MSEFKQETSNKPIKLESNDLTLVRSILQSHIPNLKVCVFGSRANGTPKPFSDLDLCIMGDDAPSSSVIADLKNALTQSTLPMRVDVVIWAQTEIYFQDIIKKQAIEIWPKIE